MPGGGSRGDIFHFRRDGGGQLGFEGRGVHARQGQGDRLRRRASRGLRERETARKAGLRPHRPPRGRRGFRVSSKPRRRDGRRRFFGQRHDRGQRDGQRPARPRACSHRALARRALPHRRGAGGRGIAVECPRARVRYALTFRAQVRRSQGLRRAVRQKRGAH